MKAKLNRQQRRTGALLIALLALGIGLDSWQAAARDRGSRTWFDGAVCLVSFPVQGALLGMARGVERVSSTVMHARELERENVQLARRSAELERAIAELREVDAAARREHALRSCYAEEALGAPLARVIGLASDGRCAYLTLDRGEADGVEAGDVAVAQAGVVGQVYAVTGRTARVIPLTDPASGIAGRVQRTRDTGVVRGLGRWRCELRYLEPEAQVLPGDLIVTSGMGGVFPGGLRVGTVTSVGSDPQSTGRTASVEPAADIRTVEEVLVIEGPRQAKEAE